MGILDGIVEWIAEQVMHGLDLITTSVLGALGCDMSVFLRYFPAAETMFVTADFFHIQSHKFSKDPAGFGQLPDTAVADQHQRQTALPFEPLKKRQAQNKIPQMGVLQHDYPVTGRLSV